MSTARATYAFEGSQAGDLSFRKNEIITIIQRSNTGWWTGRAMDGRVGIFPYNRVQVLEDDMPGNGARVNAPAIQVVDRIDSMEVVPVSRTATTVVDGEFRVEASLSNGSKVSSTKSIKHFRTLLAASRTLADSDTQFRNQNDTNFSISVPEWADMLPLTDQQMHVRADLLYTFLEAINNGNAQLEYLIVYWLSPNAAKSFSLPDDRKSLPEKVMKQAVKLDLGSGGVAVPQLAKVSFDWVQRDDHEISLMREEIIAIITENTEYTGWWEGQKVNGKKGLFPYNYIAKIPAKLAESLVNNKSQIETQLPSPPPMIVFNNGADELRPKFAVSMAIQNPFSNPGKKSKGRLRNRITKYSLSCTEAFDQLLTQGFTIEENGKLRTSPPPNCPKFGDQVSLLYSGFIWEPQKQELLEFASSDVLLNNEEGKIQAGPLEFTIGREEAIEGVEEAVQNMCLGMSVRVTLDPEKGYGDPGYPPLIPSNAYLVYDLTLQEIKKGANKISVLPGGLAKSTLMNKPHQGGGEFKGFKSMQDNFLKSEKETFEKNQKKMELLGGVGVKQVDSEQFKKKLTLEQLQEIVRKRNYEEYGIVPGIIEEYLTDEAFTEAFKVDHFMWLLMPAFKRKQLKQQAQLY